MRSIWMDVQDLATILNPFRTVFDDLCSDRPCETLNIWTVDMSEASTFCVETRRMPVLAEEETSSVETGRMASGEPGQMYAAETRQMSAVETG